MYMNSHIFDGMRESIEKSAAAELEAWIWAQAESLGMYNTKRSKHTVHVISLVNIFVDTNVTEMWSPWAGRSKQQHQHDCLDSWRTEWKHRSAGYWIFLCTSHLQETEGACRFTCTWQWSACLSLVCNSRGCVSGSCACTYSWVADRLHTKHPG